MTTTTFDTQSIATSTRWAAPARRRRKPPGDLRENFMTLLITQLKNQDPLKPMENAEADLAAGADQHGQRHRGARYHRQGYQWPDRGRADPAGGGADRQGRAGAGQYHSGRPERGGRKCATPFGLAEAGPADAVKVTITGKDGSVIRQFDLGELKAGVDSFTWDGKLADGTTWAEKGAYTVSVEASNDGKPVEVKTLNYALVGGISIGADGPLLDLGADLRTCRSAGSPARPRFLCIHHFSVGRFACRQLLRE